MDQGSGPPARWVRPCYSSTSLHGLQDFPFHGKGSMEMYNISMAVHTGCPWTYGPFHGMTCCCNFVVGTPTKKSLSEWRVPPDFKYFDHSGTTRFHSWFLKKIPEILTISSTISSKISLKFFHIPSNTAIISSRFFNFLSIFSIYHMGSWRCWYDHDFIRDASIYLMGFSRFWYNFPTNRGKVESRKGWMPQRGNL